MAEGLTVRIETTTYVGDEELLFEGGYIHLKKGKLARTIELSPSVFADVDRKGSLLGIEFLEIPFAAHILFKAAERFKVPILRRPKRIPALKALVA